jgi:type I restriction enzyme R subunit
MTHIGEKEFCTQQRLIRLFEKRLGYAYLGNWKDREGNSNIEEELLKKYLQKKQHSDSDIRNAIDIFKREINAMSNGLYQANLSVYSLLRYGVNILPEAGENRKYVHLIDWKKPWENNFYIAEEVTVHGNSTKRPDLVIYINGIAIAIIELKRSTISVHNGIRQNIDNQKDLFIQSFFTTNQLIFAGNDTEGLYYGVIETPEKFWLHWKEANSDDEINELDRSILQLFDKKRLLELIHDFIIFDAGKKKACRPNQYFGVKAAQLRVQKKESGIIWHSQGSGKSLTMIWLAQWIHENVDDARVVIITDRDELDKQIETGFKNTGEKIVRATSGYQLIGMLNNANPWLICTLIHKFGRNNSDGEINLYGKKSRKTIDQYLDEITQSLPENFKAKGNIFVFVDECHRTHGGYMHEAMRKIMGDDVMLIGFSGTPLLKTDKKTSLETFGSYIHTYKFNEAVDDKVILDLRYEARTVEQYLGDKTKIDEWFEQRTLGLSKIASAQLKQRWARMEKLFSSRERIQRIVADICQDMDTKRALSAGYGNAMLVADSIYQACRYWEIFQETTLKGHCAVVTSYGAGLNDLKGNSVGEGKTEDEFKYETYQKILDGKTPEQFFTLTKPCATMDFFRRFVE